MAISIAIPPDLEESLRREFDDFDVAAAKAMGVDLYRQRKISHAELGRLLNLSRYEVDGVLKRRGSFYDWTAVDVSRDAETSRQARKCLFVTLNRD